MKPPSILDHLAHDGRVGKSVALTLMACESYAENLNACRALYRSMQRTPVRQSDQFTTRLRSAPALAMAAVALIWLVVPLRAQDHESRWELTEQFIRDTWLHPVCAIDVKVLGPGPVHGPSDDCEIHIGVELKDQTISDFANIVVEPPQCLQG